MPPNDCQPSFAPRLALCAHFGNRVGCIENQRHSMILRHNKMGCMHILRLVMGVLSLSSVSGRGNDVIFGDIRRRDQEFCEDGILRELKANLDVIIDIDSSGCDSEEALFDIGQVIRKVVKEVEAQIPRYENEKMETTVCPLPILEAVETRFLRASYDDREELDRYLQANKKNRKKIKKRPSKRRYRYRGGVKCQRCLTRLNNSDRRRLQDQADRICEKADIAVFAADMAGTAVENADETLEYLRKEAMECDELKSSTEALANANSLVQQCKDSKQIALNESKRARQQCQMARAAQSQSELQRYDQLASTATNDAVNAARNAKRRYVLLRNSLEKNVCTGNVQENNGPMVTIEQVCNEADMAECASDLAVTAVSNAAETFAVLKDRALECDDLLTLQPVITNAKGALGEARRAMRFAKNGAKKARARCGNAREATSGSELMGYMQEAEQASEDVVNAAEQARIGYLLLKDELEKLDVCEIAPSPVDLALGVESPDDGVVRESEFQDESLYETTLKDWLVGMARALYDTLPGRLMEEYDNATFPKGCNIEGFDVKIRIDVLESSQELTFWVTEETCEKDEF
jgi:hypothetical protein